MGEATTTAAMAIVATKLRGREQGLGEGAMVTKLTIVVVGGDDGEREMNGIFFNGKQLYNG